MLRAYILDLGGKWDDHLRLLSLPTTIAIMPLLRWLLINHYMVEGVDHQYVGMRLKKENH